MVTFACWSYRSRRDCRCHSTSRNTGHALTIRSRLMGRTSHLIVLKAKQGLSNALVHTFRKRNLYASIDGVNTRLMSAPINRRISDGVRKLNPEYQSGVNENLESSAYELMRSWENCLVSRTLTTASLARCTCCRQSSIAICSFQRAA